MKAFALAALLFLTTPNWAVAAPSVRGAGGVPSMVALSVGFGQNFSDDQFVNLQGLGTIGVIEFFGSDIWLSSGLYTNVTFVGDLLDKEEEMVKMPDAANLPSEGWGVSPGLVLGFTIGLVPLIDIHLLGYVGPSFSLLTRFQEQNGMRVKIDEMDGQIGYDYGAVLTVAYKGNNPWIRGLTLGIEGGYHENSFDQWHLGFTVGVSF